MVFSNPYQPNYQQNYQQPYPAVQPMVQQPQQMQNGDLVYAPDMNYVNNYPVAIGTSVLFKMENEPIIIEKSRGYSQMARPDITLYRMEKETTQQNDLPTVTVDYTTKQDLDNLRKDYAKLRDDVDVIRKSITLFTDKEKTDE